MKSRQILLDCILFLGAKKGDFPSGEDSENGSGDDSKYRIFETIFYSCCLIKRIKKEQESLIKA